MRFANQFLQFALKFTEMLISQQCDKLSSPDLATEPEALGSEFDPYAGLLPQVIGDRHFAVEVPPHAFRVRAVAIACALSYDSAYDLLKANGRKCSRRIRLRPLLEGALLNEYRFKWIAFPASNTPKTDPNQRAQYVKRGLSQASLFTPVQNSKSDICGSYGMGKTPTMSHRLRARR
jgi:hypothetical protein